ncbi:MAG TPA: ATP-binding protein [Polyangiaceae bacterium]
MNFARFTFRTKILGIVGIAALAMVAVVVANVFLGRKLDRQLGTIQERYLPKLELEPALEGQFDRVRRAFQDAVAVRDVDELAVAKQAKERFFAELDAAHTAVAPEADRALREAFDDYFTSAGDMVRRLVAGETGESVVAAVTEMQAKQERVTTLMHLVSSLDKRELAEAFASTARVERAVISSQIWLGAAGVALVLLLSLGLSASVLRSLSALAAGLQRFGTGDFREPIDVVTHDELGRVAFHANQMAANLERAGRERERAEVALRRSNGELEAFSYSVAHDLRSPLRAINGFSHALLEDHVESLNDEAKGFLRRVAAAAERMGQLIDALLALSRLSRAELRREAVDLSKVAEAVVQHLRASQPERQVEFVTQENLLVEGDPILLRAVLENLLGNAWKFTGTRPSAKITFGVEDNGQGRVYVVRDNGAGFDMAYANKLFTPFQRLHSASEFAGTGIGLATVDRIVQRHGGRIWAKGAVGDGASFHFTLPTQPEEAVA